MPAKAPILKAFADLKAFRPMLEQTPDRSPARRITRPNADPKIPPTAPRKQSPQIEEVWLAKEQAEATKKTSDLASSQLAKEPTKSEPAHPIVPETDLPPEVRRDQDPIVTPLPPRLSKRQLAQESSARQAAELERIRALNAVTLRTAAERVRLNTDATRLVRSRKVMRCPNCRNGHVWEPCEDCDGTGEGVGRRLRRSIMLRCNNTDSTCIICGGAGQFIEYDYYIDYTCTKCGGKRSHEAPCSRCSGVGLLASGRAHIEIETALIDVIKSILVAR